MRLLPFLIPLLLSSTPALAQTPPIRLHPANPRYFEWRGKPLALITAAEHYGAVVNQDFDYRRYLETLQRDGMNYTRVFAGTYVEPPGAFGIERNTLAPAAGRFLAPWARSDQPGYAGGGNKLDLERFDPAYLARLKDFLTEAGRRGVVVELTLFCSTYGDKQWAVHPLNPANNVQEHAVKNFRAMHTTDAEPALLAVQERLVRHLVRELNAFDNLFYEIQNEPWADNHVMGETINPYLADKHPGFPNAVEVTAPRSVNWQAGIARIIGDEESRLPHRHLIAQNVANFRLPINPKTDLAPGVSVANFHYAHPEAVVWNRGLNAPAVQPAPAAKRPAESPANPASAVQSVTIGCDETGFAGRNDSTYRRQAWNFVMSGGALFNHLDYSFTAGKEDGTDTTNKAPGGGSPALRRHLKILADFLHSFDLTTLRPDTTVVVGSPGAVSRALGSANSAYAVYLEGRSPTTLTLQLPPGHWRAEFVSPTTGALLLRRDLIADAAPVSLPTPDFPLPGAIALRVTRLQAP
jgi:hypothetical protein